MNRLDLKTINSRSPYDVHSVGDQYVFVTDMGIEYHVDFELDSKDIIARFDSEIAMFNEFKP